MDQCSKSHARSAREETWRLKAQRIEARRRLWLKPDPDQGHNSQKQPKQPIQGSSLAVPIMHEGLDHYCESVPSDMVPKSVDDLLWNQMRARRFEAEEDGSESDEYGDTATKDGSTGHGPKYSRLKKASASI